MTAISLAGAGMYLPETIVDNSFFETAEISSPLFRGCRLRRHVAPGETPASMIERATRDLERRVGADAIQEIDLLITNVTVPDTPAFGCGASVTHLLGVKPKRIIDLHNSGCVAFIVMLELARDLMRAGVVKTALLACVQNAGGRVFAQEANRKRAQSAVPGDGCGVGLVVANDASPIRSVLSRSWGKYADDMRICNDEGKPYYEPYSKPLYIDFTESRIATIVNRGNRLVPEIVREACRGAEINVSDIGLLITNQPSPIFLRNWREALMVPREKQLESFEEHGNLFGAAIPMNLARAENLGMLPKGGYVALGGFSHAGDYTAAAIWQPR